MTNIQINDPVRVKENQAPLPAGATGIVFDVRDEGYCAMLYIRWHDNLKIVSGGWLASRFEKI